MISQGRNFSEFLIGVELLSYAFLLPFYIFKQLINSFIYYCACECVFVCIFTAVHMWQS